MFSYLHTLTMWHCPHIPQHAAAAAAIDRYLLPVGPTAANLQQQAHAGTDRRLCGQTPYRFIDAAHHHHSGIPDHYSIANTNYQSNYQNFNGHALH